jgi:hypothetical protein
MTAPPRTGFLGAAFDALAAPGAARFGVRTTLSLRGSGNFFVLGSRSAVSAKRGTIESRRAVSKRIGKLATPFFGSWKRERWRIWGEYIIFWLARENSQKPGAVFL